MRFAPYLVCLGLASLAPFACSSTPTTTTAVTRPELVAVDPADFMGSIHCQAPGISVPVDDGSAGAAGADGSDAIVPPAPDPEHTARSYVATLFDVTPAADGTVPNPGTLIASSPPTSCLKLVTFAYVVAGRRYLAEVDAYREEPSELEPISAGSRLLHDASGKRVVAAWSAVCGGYPPSIYDAGTAGTAGTAGGGGTAGTAGSGGEGGGRPPGVVSYAYLTQTPHDCGDGLADPKSN